MRTLLLLAAVCTAVAAADDPKPAAPPPRDQQVGVILKDLQAAQGKLRAAARAAKTEAEGETLEKEFRAVLAATGEKLLAVAREKPDDAVAFEALGFALRTGAPAAADLLVQHHLGRDKLAELLPQLADDLSPAADKLLRAALDKSPLPAVKGAACMTLGAGLAERADGGQPTAADAEALLERAGREFGGQPWEDGTVKAAADKLLFALRHLSVGKPAPEFVSKGLDDKPAKLSDLKGKVVVLDLWATWCGPCRAMIPHERELVAKLAGKPFAFVSVSADDKKEALTDFLKDTPMPWTHWWEGGNGPNLKAWQVRAFPTLYVIDAKGVIRFKKLGNPGKQMDEVIEALVKEAEAGK